MSKELSKRSGLMIFLLMIIALIIFCFPGVANIKDNVSAAGVDPVKEANSAPVKEYDLEIAGIRVTDSNKDDILGNGKKEAVYNPGTNTLELNGGITYDKLCLTHSIVGLTIKVTKDIKILSEDNCAFAFYADTTITGPGRLYVSAPESVCISVGYELTIKDANLYLSGPAGITGGLTGEEKLVIDNSNIVCNYNEESICYFEKGIELKDAAICYGYSVRYVDGDTSFPSGYAVCDSSGSIAKDACIIPGYGLIVGDIPVTKANKDDILGNGKKEAVFIPETNTLELNGDIVSRTSYGIENYIQDLTIRTNKDVKITTNRSGPNVYLFADTTITGPGKLTLNSNYMSPNLNFAGRLKIIDANIEVFSGGFGIVGISGNSDSLIIDNSYVYATGEKVAVAFIGKGIDLCCVKITEPENARVMEQSGLFFIVMPDNDASARSVKMEPSHNWGEWTVTTPARVGKKGVETRTCSDCGRKETREIPAVDPTATPTPGSTTTPTTKPSATPADTEPTKAAVPTNAATVTLKLDKTKADLVCGKTLTLKASLKGSSSKISWKSSDNKIATVDANGKITAKQAGQVTVTATAAGKSATCTVQVLFKDVTNAKDFWYAPTYYLVNKDVVKGYDKQTLFKPANVCTRAQMVTFIWRLKGEPAPKTKTCKFSDVKKTDYFYKACIWGNENHIVEGYKDGTFGPQIVCARKHAVTFLWRLANKPKPSSTKNKFKDVKKSDYFYQATLWASEKKILAGYSDGTFRPNGDCLRRQMVTFLYKYDKYINLK